MEEVVKLTHARTCEEYADHGVSRSGFYMIDPDGEHIGEKSIEVYCNFDTGSTEVLHNFEGKVIPIDHCSTLGCAQYVVEYGVPLQQITTLMELSASCKQEVKFDCFLAPLSKDGLNHGWWLNQNGEHK